MWFKELNGGEIPSTMDNLLAAAEGETMNGLICIKVLPKLLEKRDLLDLLIY